MSTHAKEQLTKLIVDTLTVMRHGYVPREGSDYSVYEQHQYPDCQLYMANIYLGTDTFKYEDLISLSTDLGTNLIDIGSETREHGYCETCSYTESLVKLRLRWKK